MCDAAGNYLDGGDLTKAFSVLPGDYNADGVVTLQDALLVRSHMPAYGAYDLWADLDGDGDVDLTDYNLVRQHIGQRLPTP